MAEKADWVNPPKLSDLKADLQGATNAHNSHVDQVRKWLSNLKAEQKVKTKIGRSKIVPKLIRKQAEWRYPALSEPFLSTDDLFNAAPKTFEDKKAADQNMQVLNYQFSHKIDKVKFIDEYIRTGTDEGTVVVKIGWDFEEELQEVQVQGVDPETGMMVAMVQEQMVTTKNQPTVEVCHYNNIVLDPTCGGDLSKANFIIHSFETSKSELEQDGRYFDLDKIDPSANTTLTDDEYNGIDDSYFEFQDDARRKFVAYEYHGYWDYDDTGIAKQFIATWVGNVCIRMEESPFPFKGLPFELVQYLPVRKSNYGEPDGELLEDNQRVVGAITRGMIDILGRSANGQMGTRKDSLDVVNGKKFERGEDYKFNAGIDPRQAFQMGVYPEIPRSALEMINLQNNEAESLTGVKAFSAGISSQSYGDVATGIRSAMDATAKRELGILRRFGNGIVKIGHKMLKMNQEFLSDEEFIRITNEPVMIKREDLAGEFDVTLSISTPEADAEKARGLEFMLQTLGAVMPFEFTQIILVDIAKLKKQPELSKKIEEYQPQPDPAAQEKAALEIELLKAQIANESAKAQENQVDVGLKQAKTATEEAKARQMHSSSDKQDLDFVETESGVTRQHEMEMEDQRSRNKGKEKLMDAMIQDEQGAGAAGAPARGTA